MSRTSNKQEDRIVLQLDYREALEKLKNHGFDFIYCDPPYRFEEYEELFEQLSFVERVVLVKFDLAHLTCAPCI